MNVLYDYDKVITECLKWHYEEKYDAKYEKTLSISYLHVQLYRQKPPKQFQLTMKISALCGRKQLCLDSYR